MLLPIISKTDKECKVLSWNRYLEKNVLVNQLAGYSEKIFAITDYCTKLRYANLPELRNADWITTEVIEAFSCAKAIPNFWLNIQEALMWVPDTILKYNNMYERSKTIVIECLKVLIQEPERDTNMVRLHLAMEIEQLATGIESKASTAKEIAREIDDLSDRVNTAATFFAKWYNTAVDTKQADESKVQELQNVVDNLETKIKRMNDAEIGIAVAEGLVSIVAIVAMYFDISWLEILTAGVLVGTLVTSTVLEEVISEDIVELEKQQRELDDYSYDLAQLSVLKEYFVTVNCYVGPAKQALLDILSIWNNLKEQLNEIVNILRDDEKKLDTGAYREMLDSIEETEEDWQDILKVAQAVRSVAAAPNYDEPPYEIYIHKKAV